MHGCMAEMRLIVYYIHIQRNIYILFSRIFFYSLVLDKREIMDAGSIIHG